MLWETLLEKQQEVFGNRARKLKVFPLTRFAYAYLMISCALYNWPILRDIPEWPDYLIVQEKYPDARADFYCFESLVGNTVFKSEGQAAHGIIEPLSRMLHYLEGDSVPPSHLLPLYCLYYSFVCELPLAVTTRLNNETIVGVSTMVKDRWLGRTTAPRKVGLRHDLHCLAFSLDVYVRALIVLIFGEARLERIDRTYSDENVFAAIKNYNGGLEDAKYHRLVQEVESFRAKQEPYGVKSRAVEGMLRANVPIKIHPLLSDEEKKNKFIYFLCCLQHLHIITSNHTFWNSITVISSDGSLFIQMVIIVLQIIIHACSIERISKNCDMVHSKARASFRDVNVRKSIFCFTNLLLQKKTTLSYKEYCTTVLSPEDAADVVLSFETELDSSDDDLPCGGAGTAQEPLEAEDDDIDVSLPAVVHAPYGLSVPCRFFCRGKAFCVLDGCNNFSCCIYFDAVESRRLAGGQDTKVCP
ncbi:hypothetical protein CYMTET_32352 [Cymbomonas tetramitiformis]|uniref:Uncharacterized protein n=1 Tax=Cymbomonas tetramitiformis TaxID=36881 RepID=A0AAE0FF82_9CHLO|nr:hypothetical protein CYMTET_32352 [Cymbomonas tetramitiformis]